MISAVLLALAGVSTLQSSDEFGQRLEALASPAAHQRDAAERWLGAHLAPERYPALLEAARAGDAEVRQRLVHVLVRGAGHLGCALAFLGQDDPLLAALGEQAVQGSVTHSDARLGELGSRGDVLERELGELARDDPPRLVRVDPRLPLERTLEGLELFAGVPIGLTVDARIAARSSRREEEPIVAPWDDALPKLARVLGVSLEGHGLASPAAGHAARRGFVRFTSEPDTVRRTGAELVLEWLRSLHSAGSAPDSPGFPDAMGARARAARNLASSGWVPAQDWMEERFREGGDPAALEGLFSAASLGRVSDALVEPTMLLGLLDPAVDSAASPGSEARLARLLAALSRVGCHDARGEALVPALLAGFDGRSARVRWARLLLCETLGCRDPEAAARARSTLVDGAAPPALRRQALWTWVAVAPQHSGSEPVAPAVPGLLELFREPLLPEEVQRLGKHLRLVAVEPPARQAAGIPADFPPSSRHALIAAWMWRGEDGPAAHHAAALLELPGAPARVSGEELAAVFEPWVRRGEGVRVRELLAAAGKLAPARALELERVALLLGLVPARELGPVLERCSASLSGPRADVVLLGAVAGHAENPGAAASARASLIAALVEAIQANGKPEECTALFAGLERALDGLYGAGRDQEAEAFAKQVRSTLRANPRSELARRFDRLHWPLAPGIEIRDVEAELRRFEIPATL